jgi:hypothetical protein
MGRPEPMSSPWLNSYIFVGEVIGYTEPTSSDKFQGTARGIKVKPVEVINLPKPTVDYYEIFKYGVWPDCSPSPSRIVYPIGTKLRIVASESTLLPKQSDEKRIRLESKIFDRLSIDTVNGLSTSEHSAFDYKNWRSMRDEALKSEDGGSNYAMWSDFLFVEIQKDLKRVFSAKDKKERLRILERLVFAPDIDFVKVVDPKVGRLFNTSTGPIRLPDTMEPGKSYSGKMKVKATRAEKKLLEKRNELEKTGFFRS